MSEAQINAVRGVLLAVLSFLIAAQIIDPGFSDAVTGLVSAVLAGVAAFFVKPIK